MQNNVLKMPQLRLCVTEECRRNCFYCRPGGEACRASHKKEMSLRQIYQLVSILTEHGIAHLKITGGEPMIRDDIPKMIRLLNSLEKIRDIQLVTRSPRVAEIGKELKGAGLSCLNFSIDTLNPFTFFKITRNGRFNLLLQAIELCHQNNLNLKFNMVVMRDINDHEIFDMIDFAGKYNATLKLLDLMNMPGEPQFLVDYYVPFDRILERLTDEAIDRTIVKASGGLGTPMPKFKMSNGATVLVKDARRGTWYSDVCVECKNFPCQDALMALRLTADGCLQRCLLRRDNLVDLLAMMERVEDRATIDKVIDSVLSTFRNAIYYEKTWKVR